MGISRRSFFKKSAILGGVALNWKLLWGKPYLFNKSINKNDDDLLTVDSKGILDLMEGFQCKVLQRSGEKMSDGFICPNDPDAMGVFLSPSGDDYYIMRNHEVALDDVAAGPFRNSHSAYPAEMYSPRGHGGVTKMVVDRKTLELKSSFLVLAGSARNCAGGLSPWGWLTCEEVMDDSEHGHVFLCDPQAEKLLPARRIDAYGRFYHEAATVDPKTHIAYLTEDRPDGCFYRFRPDNFLNPFGPGSFEALKVKEYFNYDTSKDMSVGEILDCEWVKVEEPCPQDDSVRDQAKALGAAIVKRGEGLWLDRGEVYISSTSGGPIGRGQIFKYIPNESGLEGKLVLIAQSENKKNLNMPDNISVSPLGFLVIAEDNDGSCHIKILTPKGNILTLAKNPVSGNEFAGVCFTPDGRTLFVNIQHRGLTLAITGPFEKFLKM